MNNSRVSFNIPIINIKLYQLIYNLVKAKTKKYKQDNYFDKFTTNLLNHVFFEHVWSACHHQILC